MKFFIHGLQRRARALAYMKAPTPFRAPADNDTKSLALSSLRQPEAAPPRIQRLWGLLRGVAARTGNRVATTTSGKKELIFKDGTPPTLVPEVLTATRQKSTWSINSRVRNLATVFIGSLFAPGNDERNTASCGKAKKEKSVPSFKPYPNPSELSRDEDRAADNPGGKKAKETSGGAVEGAKRNSKRTSGKPMRPQDYFPLFHKQIQGQPARPHNNPPSPARFLSEAIRDGIHKIPGGTSLAAAANFAGQAFLSSVGGERAAALSPIRNRDKTVAIQTVGTQKYTFVNQDNKLAAAAAKGVPFLLSEEYNTQKGSKGARTN